MDQEQQPSKQTSEDRPETAGDRLLKRLGIDPNKWTVGDRRLALLGFGIGLTIVIIAVCGYIFGWEWTGMTKPTPKPDIRTFWDWLRLLIVPVVLALGGYFFTRSENRRNQDVAERQRTLDRQIADERRQDDMLQAYLDGMSQLLTDEARPLHRAQLGDSLSTVARARTLTALSRLDGDRKGNVVQFLYESGLITTDSYKLHRRILDLRSADLSEAILSEAYLSGADLSGAILIGANLRGANLIGARLFEANLRGADLSEAERGQPALLTEAILTEAILSEANLIRANLSGALLTEAILSGAILIGASLSEAHLRKAFLREANLRGADLSKADLRDARGVTEEQLEEQAQTLEGAIMPDGSVHR